MDVVSRFKEVHGDKYDYRNVVYTKMINKVEIICHEHGSFFQTPHGHLKGQGCGKCGIALRAKKRTSTSDKFIKKAKEIHGEKYDYSKVEYVKNHIKVCIICPKHGEFLQIVSDHLSGKGCPKCAKEMNVKKISLSTDEFIERCQEIHCGKYDYSNVEYVDYYTPIKIKCPIHGFFYQSPKSHLDGCDCQKCGIETLKIKRSSTGDKFIVKSKQVHGLKYDYSMVRYVNNRTNITIICPEHGEFSQKPYNHLVGHGCPKCSKNYSKEEGEICDIIKPLEYENNNRSILNGKEIDIYIPSLKLGIEYNGIRWHSEKFGKDKNYHIDKLNKCNEQGINLIQIFEDEWINKNDIVVSKLKHILNIDTNKRKIFARKCNVIEVSKDEAKDFLDKNHIEGYARASVYLGLFYENKLIALMSFKKEKDGCWCLIRFATDINYNCVGAGVKLFNYFIKNYEFKEIKSFADRRWITNTIDNLYTKLGFEFVGFTKPDYRYFINGEIERYDKIGFRKKVLHEKYGLPITMSENEMFNELGVYKIWDCGFAKYVYRNNFIS